MKHSEKFEILSKIHLIQQRKTGENKEKIDAYIEKQEKDKKVMKIVRTESNLIELREEWFIEDWSENIFSLINVNFDPQWIVTKKWHSFLKRYRHKVWKWEYIIEDNQIPINFILTFLSLFVAILALLH